MTGMGEDTPTRDLETHSIRSIPSPDLTPLNTSDLVMHPLTGQRVYPLMPRVRVRVRVVRIRDLRCLMMMVVLLLLAKGGFGR